MTPSEPNPGQITGKLIVLTHTARWPAAIDRQRLPAETINAVDLDDVMAEARSHPGSVAVIELIQGKIPQLCKQVANLANNAFQLRLIALGAPESVEWDPLVRLAGFAEAYWSTIHARRLPHFMESHFRSVQWPRRSLEQQIESSLPWPKL